MLTPDGKKRCPRCETEKVADGNFYKVNRATGDGYAGYCIECIKAKAVDWQKENPERKKLTDALRTARQTDDPVLREKIMADHRAAQLAHEFEVATRRAEKAITKQQARVARAKRGAANALQPDGTKRCTKCGQVKVAEGNFYKTKDLTKGRDGYLAQCAACSKARLDAWAAAHPDRAKARQDEWRAKNPEKVRDSVRKRRADPERYAAELARAAELRKADPEKARARGRRYYEKHHDRARAQTKKYQTNNKEKVRESTKAYRASPVGSLKHRQNARLRYATCFKKNGGPDGLLSFEQWTAICEAFGGACCYCARTDRPLTMEHLTPITREGRHVVGNVAPACHQCNAGKGNKTVEEFAPDRAAQIRATAMISDPSRDARGPASS